MNISVCDRFVMIQPSLAAPNHGTFIRTASSLKELITDLITNSGEEIAMWSEEAGKVAADTWRKVHETPQFDDTEDGDDDDYPLQQL